MNLKDRSDEQIISGLTAAVTRELESLIDVLLHINEFDGRRLWEHVGHASTYRYCVDALKLPEQAAYERICVARLVDRFPDLLAALKEGSIGLEGAMILAPKLNKANAADLVQRSRGKTNIQIQFLVAELSPRPDLRETVRLESRDAGLSQGIASSCSTPVPLGGKGTDDEEPLGAPERPPQGKTHVEPLSAERIRLGLTVERTCYEALERVRTLIWHKNPAAKLEHALSEAVEFYLIKKDPERRMDRQESTKRQLPPWRSSDPVRRIPQAVKDDVWRRDSGQCSFIRPDGSRCPERKALEYDHIVPFALGGPSNTAKNVRLLCWGHNQTEARRRFGPPELRSRPSDLQPEGPA